jgi:predicted nucleic acid-binding protein
VTAVDSSVVIAACAEWHQSHKSAREVLDEGPRLIGHSALEAFSVLTRLPWPNRISGNLVIEFLGDWFPDDPLVLSASIQKSVPNELQQLGIAGGGVYDGLIAITARTHGAELLSLDRRAESIYQRCGTRCRLLGPPAD